MFLRMTKIYKFQDDISVDTLKELEKHSSLAIDTEGSGLQIPHRDKLSLIQISSGNNEAYIIQPNRKNYKAPNLVKILENFVQLKGNWIKHQKHFQTLCIFSQSQNLYCNELFYLNI